MQLKKYIDFLALFNLKRALGHLRNLCKLVVPHYQKNLHRVIQKGTGSPVGKKTNLRCCNLINLEFLCLMSPCVLKFPEKSKCRVKWSLKVLTQAINNSVARPLNECDDVTMVTRQSVKYSCGGPGKLLKIFYKQDSN